MPGYDKIPTYLNPEQRHALTQISSDLSDRDIARYYTFYRERTRTHLPRFSLRTHSRYLNEWLFPQKEERPLIEVSAVLRLTSRKHSLR